jgi:hypothetical protein
MCLVKVRECFPANRIVPTKSVRYDSSPNEAHVDNATLAIKEYASMFYFKVVSPYSGLRLGRIIKVVPKFPIETGERIACRINGRLTVGKWHANVAGLSWIRQRGRLIPLIGEIVVCILGVVEEGDEE